MKKNIYILIALLLITLSVSAQSADKANRLFEKGQYEDALKQYELLLKRNPKNILYTYRTARCLQELGKYSEALPLFAKTGKKYPLTYFFTAECYQALWMPEEAIANYQLYLNQSTSNERDTYIQNQINIAEKRSRYIKRVMDISIIDSIKISKAQILNAYPLSSESGKLSLEENGSITYTNGKGDRRFFIHQDSDSCSIQQQYRLLQHWEPTETLPSTVNRAAKQGYPFCMSDGITFYFASQSEDGLGGWDIYMTRYNSTNNTFAAAENIGYPFNSEADDYLYVVDEQAGVGYFATNRNCSADSVCVYTFLLEDQPRYLPASLPNDTLKAYAQLTTYHRANKPQRTIETNTKPEEPKQTLCFVINDNVIYTSMSDFRSDDAKRTYLQYEEWLKELNDMNSELDELRRFYTEANSDQRKKITETILSVENRRNQLQQQVETAAQKIRRLEQQSSSQPS